LAKVVPVIDRALYALLYSRRRYARWFFRRFNGDIKIGSSVYRFYRRELYLYCGLTIFPLIKKITYI